MIRHTPVTPGVLGMALLRFVYTFLGSVGIGVGVGLLSALVCYRHYHRRWRPH